jgi:predicted dehydrogenase
MVKKDKKLRFGVVGAGKIGNYHIRTLSRMPNVELVGICDVNSARAQMLAWKYNCMTYMNHEDLIPQVDALIIATPTEYHKDIGVSAMEKGVHCLIEKPIAISMDEARELLDVSKKKNVVLQVGHVERFNPALQEAAKYIKNPRFIVVERLGPYDPRVSSIGVILDLMIHDIDLILSLVNSPVESFEAVGASLLSQHEDIANLRFRFKNGAIADLTASRASFEKARNMRVYQEENYLSVDFMNSRIKMYKRKVPNVQSLKDIEVVYPNIEKHEPIMAEIQHFIDCIHNSKKPVPSGEIGSFALDYALKVTQHLNRYELSGSKDAPPPGPIRVVSDIGRATKIVINETLKNIGVDKY